MDHYSMDNKNSHYDWSIAQSNALYGVSSWSREYFKINEKGNIVVTNETATVELCTIIEDLKQRGVKLPVILRFSDILKARIKLINDSFNHAIEAYEYHGNYQGVYPIKVNQSRKVVEEIIEFGKPYHFGLEIGSKPELLAGIAMASTNNPLIICNGYKDIPYIEMALLASQLGQNMIIVIENEDELLLIHEVSQRLKIKPRLGIRACLSTRGSGRWEQSTGDRSKFGLLASAILRVIQTLKETDMLDCFELLHFHIGSQISSIHTIKAALQEASRFFVELHQLGCHNLHYFDVGGGLGVDYNGSQTNFNSSINYTIEEYANDVVFSIAEACIAAKIPHPTIITESGRAIAAYHSVLIVNVLGTKPIDTFKLPSSETPRHPIAHNLYQTYQAITEKNLIESYHDAIEYKDKMLQLFNLGHLSLAMRAECEQLFGSICHCILKYAQSNNETHDELESLTTLLSTVYFCNFSMFQSLPDIWAIKQLFPIVPIHRHQEKPAQESILADITCDSDGTIDRFVDTKGVNKTIPLHDMIQDPYYLGVFLVGAYQEILGDMHNLFGDTHIAHVSLNKDTRYTINEVIVGDSVSEILHYVDYHTQDLIDSVKRHIDFSLQKNRLTTKIAETILQHYIKELDSYSYLDTHQ